MHREDHYEREHDGERVTEQRHRPKRYGVQKVNLLDHLYQFGWQHRWRGRAEADRVDGDVVVDVSFDQMRCDDNLEAAVPKLAVEAGAYLVGDLRCGLAGDERLVGVECDGAAGFAEKPLGRVHFRDGAWRSAVDARGQELLLGFTGIENIVYEVIEPALHGPYLRGRQGHHSFSGEDTAAAIFASAAASSWVSLS